MIREDVDLLIVGAGIAGAALACALRDAPYRIAVVERRTGPLDTARGDHLQPCNVELLHEWGVLEDFLRRGARRRTRHEFRTAGGEVLLEADYRELELPHPYYLVFDHDKIADLFLELARRSPNVSEHWGVAARDYDVVGDRVEALRLETSAGMREIRPRLIVAADGALSGLRQRMGFETDDFTYRHPMVALFGERPADLAPEQTFFRYSSPSGMLVIQERMDGTIKVTLPIGDEGIPWWKASSVDDRRSHLVKRAHVLESFEASLAGFYPVTRRYARRYAQGNVVLVGDAAHAMHPARGQGLNMGIYSLRALLESLPDPTDLGRPERVAAALRGYEERQRPGFDAILSKNHEAALAMDEADDASMAAVMRQQDDALRIIHRDPKLRRQHLLEATGYPFGVPSPQPLSA